MTDVIADAEAFLDGCYRKREELIALIDHAENRTLELWDNDADRCIRVFGDEDRAALVASLRFWLEQHKRTSSRLHDVPCS